MKRKNRGLHALIITIFFFIYALTFLPNFGIFNDLKFIGPFPQALSWVLILNAINTVIIFIVYFKFFKPFAKRLEEIIEVEEEIKK